MVMNLSTSSFTMVQKVPKEAEIVRVHAIPASPGFRHWRQQIRLEVASASGRPELANLWILRVEHPAATFDNMSMSGRFQTLDSKLGAALMKACSGTLSRRIALVAEQQAKNMTFLKGRQILWMIYQWFKTQDEAGALHDIMDIFAVRLRGDDLEGFLTTWETILAGVSVPIDKKHLVALFSATKTQPIISALCPAL